MSRKLTGFNAPTWLRWTAFVLLAVVFVLGRDLVGVDTADTMSAVEAGDVRVQELFAAQRSGVMVTVEGMIDRVLEDDNRGSRHQRFIVRLGSGNTLLIAHNIDIAERVPFERGDDVRIRGEYEWNAQGGLLHWTHHDPGGDRPGGWVEFAGTRYR